MASLAERAAAAKAAKAAQGVAQAAPTVSAALSAPPPPPPPPPAPAEARTEPRGAPRREEPRRVPKPQGGGTPRRETPPPPPKTERLEATAAVSTSSGQPLTTRFSPKEMVQLGELSEKKMLAPADEKAYQEWNQGLTEAMQRVDELRLSRQGMASGMRSAGGGYAYRMPTMLAGKPSEQPARFSDIKPVPEDALKSVAAFRDEVLRRAETLRDVSRKVGDLDATRLVIEDVKKTEQAPPRMRTVQRADTPYETKLRELAWMIRTLKPEMAAARANLVEMGLTEEQIDQLAR